jgi:hypothetical protein
VTNRWIGWTLGVMALTVSASAGFACDQAANAADAKDAKAVASNGASAGCDMPCCAHAKAGDKVAAEAPAEKPCAAHDGKGCPKKAAATATAVAKTDPAKDAAKPDPAADPGTNR